MSLEPPFQIGHASFAAMHLLSRSSCAYVHTQMTLSPGWVCVYAWKDGCALKYCRSYYYYYSTSPLFHCRGRAMDLQTYAPTSSFSPQEGRRSLVLGVILPTPHTLHSILNSPHTPTYPQERERAPLLLAQTCSVLPVLVEYTTGPPLTFSPSPLIGCDDHRNPLLPHQRVNPRQDVARAYPGPQPSLNQSPYHSVCMCEVTRRDCIIGNARGYPFPPTLPLPNPK